MLYKVYSPVILSVNLSFAKYTRIHEDKLILMRFLHKIEVSLPYVSLKLVQPFHVLEFGMIMSVVLYFFNSVRLFYSFLSPVLLRESSWSCHSHSGLGQF